MYYGFRRESDAVYKCICLGQEDYTKIKLKSVDWRDPGQVIECTQEMEDAAKERWDMRYRGTTFQRFSITRFNVDTSLREFLLEDTLELPVVGTRDNGTVVNFCNPTDRAVSAVFDCSFNLSWV